MGAVPGVAIVQRDRAKAGAGTGTGEGGGRRGSAEVGAVAGTVARAGTEAGAGNVAEAVGGHNLLHSAVILRRCWMSCMTHTHFTHA